MHEGEIFILFEQVITPAIKEETNIIFIENKASLTIQ
jgi:hypothetical protein